MPRSSTVSTTASLAGRDPELVHKPAHAGAEHDAGQVVAAEHERLLDHAGREHDLAGPEPVHRVALVDGHEVALVDAAGPGRLEDLDAAARGRRLELGRPGGCGDARERQPPAQGEALVDERRVAAVACALAIAA